MRLVWCQGGNPTSARMAVEAGWWYGFRTEGRGSNHYAADLGPVALCDCRWENTDWPRHLEVVAQVQPWLATVPDTMGLDELDRTLAQAEALAQHSPPLVVPKCPGLIERLPRQIGGRAVVLGYSVPTGYGGTDLPLWDFRGWPVHVLGGNPRAQAEVASYLTVISADGNMAWRLARRGIVVQEDGVAGRTLRELDGERWPHGDAHLEALRRSLRNLRRFWEKCRPGDIEWRQGHPGDIPHVPPQPLDPSAVTGAGPLRKALALAGREDLFRPTEGEKP